MIDTIIEEIRDNLKSIKLKESEEWFDTGNAPDSIIDNCFVIAPVNLEPGDLSGAQNRTGFQDKIINLAYPLKLFYSKKIPANDMIQVQKDSALQVENIIKSILSIEVGSNDKDSISFVGASPGPVGNAWVYEIDFNINYRIKNF